MSLLNDDIPQPKDKSNDLMLLRLSEPADITDAVKPIDLPTEEPKLGSTCLASGWGSITPTKCEYGPRIQRVVGEGQRKLDWALLTTHFLPDPQGKSQMTFSVCSSSSCPMRTVPNPTYIKSQMSCCVQERWVEAKTLVR
jgi:hypothetical protein